ncbi:phosphoribosyl-ATP pyrophosphohydrolase [Maricaulis salignorans]|uniref:Phosphoribosyl-ATP pyrophosphohydrolase n=1 Tax=Maricaulis salignorans TaxID=144026 RepID=A0A1G9SB49_9PROT|nr:phosphoribosyl-ATP pyrophosphohydrolase [Maricaulis salignorans]SDM32733.1 Phosphoribosyl-ATP pyrophosphohydrolase [Maricaulis salignorans]
MSEASPSCLNALGARIAQVSDIYAERYQIDRSGDWYLLKLQEELGELTQAYLTTTGRSRKPADEGARENLAREMADALGMLLLMARDEGIDLDAAVQEKWLSWLEREDAS